MIAIMYIQSLGQSNFVALLYVVDELLAFVVEGAADDADADVKEHVGKRNGVNQDAFSDDSRVDYSDFEHVF